MIGVKDPNKSGFNLHYRDIGDYLSAAEKLAIVDTSTIANVDWQSIVPNQHGDWLNQRSDEFETWPVIGEKKGDTTKFFRTYTAGLKTGRDAWSYSSGTGQLVENIGTHVANYRQAQELLRSEGFEESKRGVDALFAQHPELVDSTQGSWNVNLKQELARGTEIAVNTDRVYTSLYRPFFKQRSYFAKELNDRMYQLPSMFPTPAHQNIGFGVCTASTRTPFSLIASDLLPNLSVFVDPVQFFPRFTWEPVEASDGGLFGKGASISEGESSMCTRLYDTEGV